MRHDSIPLFKVRMHDKIEDFVIPVLKSGYIGEGPKVKEFEQVLKQYFKNPYILTTNSATSAEHLVLRILKDHTKYCFGERDEVLSTPLTCTATNFPILANGLKIKWVDIDPNTFNLDLDDLEKKLTNRTRFIVVVHWGGYSVDLDKLHKICDKYEISHNYRPIIIQDCAHAMGTTFKDKQLTEYSDFCTYSFQAIKHVTSGDGGMLVTPVKMFHDKAKLLRWYGIDRDQPRNDFRCEAPIRDWGYKFHMNDVAAAIGLANFSLLEDTLRKHRNNADFYYQQLSNISGIKLSPKPTNQNPAWWLFTLRVERRDDFVRVMTEKGIQVSRVHERNDKHPCVKEFKVELPQLDKLVQEMICIPVGWYLSQEDKEYIVDSIKKGW